MFYKKVFSREHSLYRAEIVSSGENEGIRGLTGGKYYFKPLFISEGRIVSLYYDFDDSRQSAPKITQYFDSHLNELKKIILNANKDCAKLQKCLLNEPKSVSKIIGLIKKIQPVSSICGSIGLFENIASEELLRVCKDYREKNDALIYRAEESLKQLFTKLLPKKYVPFIKVLLSKEIISLELPSIKELKKRQKEFVYFLGELSTEKELFLNKKGIVVQEENEGRGKQLKGSCACKGKIKAIAQVIKDLSQLGKFKQGNILVTSMTTPNFVPIMQKAKAIITDEGGVTCHAAIVSRELRIPCIVGTVNATKIIRDGDLIEMDAEAGTIKILKR